jgi:hypothetical protein
MLKWSSLGRGVQYPAIMFWIALAGFPTGLISGLIVYERVTGTRRIPPVALVLAYSRSSMLCKIGGLLSAVGICCVGHRTHWFFKRLMDVSRHVRLRSTLRVFIALFDTTITLHVWSLVSILFLRFGRFPRSHLFFTVLYFISGISFHFSADYAAARTKRYVPLSFGINVLLAVLTGISGILFCLESARVFGLACFLEFVCFLLLHLKYMFVGVNLLGNQFIPGLLYRLESDGRKSSGSDPLL